MSNALWGSAKEVPPWRVGASARGDDRITWGRSARPIRTRAPGSEDGRKAIPIGLLTNAMLIKSTAVARLNKGRRTSRARGIARGSVLAIWQEGALGAVVMAWRNVRGRMWLTLSKAIFKLTDFKITRIKCGLPCKMQWWATCSNIAEGSWGRHGHSNSGQSNCSERGSMHARVLAWDLEGVSNSRDARGLLQHGTQTITKSNNGGLRGSAKAGWAAKGDITYTPKGRRTSRLAM